jgi:hypothetical protein
MFTRYASINVIQSEPQFMRGNNTLILIHGEARRLNRQFTRRETNVRISFDARPNTDKPSARHEASSLDSLITRGKAAKAVSLIKNNATQNIELSTRAVISSALTTAS